MSHRELPDFLKHGDRELGAPQARYPGMQIGKCALRAGVEREPPGDDPQSARDWAVRGWLAMVAAGW